MPETARLYSGRAAQLEDVAGLPGWHRWCMGQICYILARLFGWNAAALPLTQAVRLGLQASSSMTVALAMPPPSHIVCSP